MSYCSVLKTGSNANGYLYFFKEFTSIRKFKNELLLMSTIIFRPKFNHIKMRKKTNLFLFTDLLPELLDGCGCLAVVTKVVRLIKVGQVYLQTVAFKFKLHMSHL